MGSGTMDLRKKVSHPRLRRHHHSQLPWNATKTWGGQSPSEGKKERTDFEPFNRGFQRLRRTSDRSGAVSSVIFLTQA